MFGDRSRRVWRRGRKERNESILLVGLGERPSFVSKAEKVSCLRCLSEQKLIVAASQLEGSWLRKIDP